MKVVGYSDTLSLQPDETIRFMVSCDLPKYRADIVRLIHGDTNPKGQGFKEEEIDASINGSYQGRKYSIDSGSYVLVPEHSLLGTQSGFTLQCWIYPTTPMKPNQGIFTNWCVATQTGYGLLISNGGKLSIWVGDKHSSHIEISSGVELQRNSWYFVCASYDAKDRKIILVQSPAPEWPGDPQVVVDQELEKSIIFGNKGAVSIGCYFNSDASRFGSMQGFFNGKIDGPRLFNRGLGAEEITSLSGRSLPDRHKRWLVASWDFSIDIEKTLISDMSSNQLHGHAINMPTRGVTGHNWTGKETVCRQAPDEYAAIHFHDDDLDDARWPVGFEYEVPSDMKSGVYAARLTAGEETDYLPFFVRPRSGGPTGRIAFLAPTLTYIAYANKQLKIDRSNPIYSDLPLDFEYPSQKEDKFIVENGLIGTYDRHIDGSGVCYSSRLRPMLNFRPSYNFPPLANGRGSPHLLSADLHLLDWMEHQGHKFDVITDEDLHNEGASLLRPYNVIVSGTHPEYWSMIMLDGLEEYLFEGGRLAYLGGNGFYWVTSVEEEFGHTVEVRRWGGTQTWEAAPGEYHHSTTGELGGLWRNRGRAPQKLVGVGMTSQGYDKNAPYHRTQDGFHPKTEFIFEGIPREEAIGNFPSLVMEHGAAGFEIDRADSNLGTPGHTFIIATANQYSDSYQHVIEEVYESDSRQGASVNSKVKSDMVYLLYPNQGAVFSVGSISWCSCLSYNHYENSVSQITNNVLTRFSSGENLYQNSLG